MTTFTLNGVCYLFNDPVTAEARDKLSRRSDGEVPLEVNAPAISSLFHQVQARHAGSVWRRHKEHARCPSASRSVLETGAASAV